MLPWPLLVLLFSPLLILWPFVFGGYTLSQNDIGSDKSQPYGRVGIVPVADPAGSSLLDEPYLVHIKSHLLRGRLPVLDMKNGLGSPGVESLLVGTFYVLNPLLLLLPTHKPLYYDMFQILHVYILLIGIYCLLRWYVEPFTAACTSILVTFCGVTYLWFNMEHYRNFVWLPWMLTATVGIVRQVRLRRHCWLLVFTIVACGTAGNPQEFGAALVATALVYSCEYFASSSEDRPAPGVFPLCLVAGLLIASINILPFAFSMRDGNLFATNDPGRSVRPYDVIWVFSWVLPRITGYYPHLFLRNQPYWPHADFSTTGFFLLMVGFIFGVFSLRRKLYSAGVVLCTVIPVFILLALIKIVHIRLLDIIEILPVVRSFLFIKYYLYLFVLAAIPIACGLQYSASLPFPNRRKLLATSAGLVMASIFVILCVLYARSDYSIQSGVPPIVQILAFGTYAVSVGTFCTILALLYWQPKAWRGIMMTLLVLQAALFVPPGFGKRIEMYPKSYHAAALPATNQERVLIRQTADTNLFFNVEAITMYDAVVNKYYRNFINTFFGVINYGAIYQPNEVSLTGTQVAALRLIGTSGVFGYGAAPNTDAVQRLAPDAYKILKPLPRAFVLSQNTFNNLKSLQLSPQNISSILDRIQTDVATLPQPSQIQVADERVHLNTSQVTQGVLVLNQAYSTYWRYGSRKPERMLELWPAWPISPSQHGGQQISYWPTGLSVGIAAAVLGLCIMFAFDTLILRSSPEPR